MDTSECTKEYYHKTQDMDESLCALMDLVALNVKTVRARYVNENTKCRNKLEAITFPAIRRLESYVIGAPYSFSQTIRNMENVIDDMIIILDFVRSKKWEKGSKFCYLISDVMEMARDITETKNMDTLHLQLIPIRCWLREIKTRMLKFGADGDVDFDRDVDVSKGGGDVDGDDSELGDVYFDADDEDVSERDIDDEDEISEGDVYSDEDVSQGDVDTDEDVSEGDNGDASEGDDGDASEGDDGDENEYVLELVEDVKMLLERAIFTGEEGLLISTVTGIVGIGKTSLVEQVYYRDSVIRRFKHRAWVCVSRNLSIKEVLIKLILQVVDNKVIQRDSLLKKVERSNNRGLQGMLHSYLQGKPYLIILDDMPKEMRLESILLALPRSDEEGRLLMTSRTQNKGHYNQYAHPMKTLDPYNSWELFVKEIFSGKILKSEYKFPKQLEKKAKEVLAKCGGLPLAIKHIGRQLAEKRLSGSEWEDVLESIDLAPILELLEFSYQTLDQELKPCFLYLSFFKENITVRVEKLTQIWDAGGMVFKPNLNTLPYLDDLVSLSIINVKEERIPKGIKSCRVNALLHKLSIKKAEDDIDFEIIGSNGDNRPSQNPRHRVMNCSRDRFSYSTDKDKYLVSLFFRGGGNVDVSPSYWESFEQLRILDLEDFGLRTLPETIGVLMELVYLGLRNNHLLELPQSLGCLKKLEVFDIALNFLVEVPDIIWEMVSLKHLYMSNVILQKPLKINALHNLESLTYISADNLIYEHSHFSKKKTSLHTLGIENLDGNSNIGKLIQSLVKLDCLKKLILRGFRFKRMPCLDELCILHGITKLKLDGLVARLPSAGNFPPNLRELKLVNTRLDEDPMPILEKLPMLEYLKLRNAYTGRQMVILQDGFSVLEVLCMEEMWNLRSVQVEKDAMPILRKLEIKQCPYLKSLPEETRWMHFLKEFKMVTTKNVATKIHKYMKETDLINEVHVVDINP